MKASEETPIMTKPTTTTVAQVPINKLHPDPENRDVGVDIELKKSIAAVGVTTALLIRDHPDKKGEYEIVAGERRWRAASAAKLTTVPCLLFTGTESERIVAQALENLQRKDLTPFEEGQMYVRAVEADLTIKDLAAKVGVSAAVVKRRIALLDLPEAAKEKVLTGEWSPTDAAALLPHAENKKLITWALNQDFNPTGHHSLPTAIEREAKARKAKAALALRKKALKAEGTYTTSQPWQHTLLTSLGFDVAKHAAEPCHGFRLYLNYNGEIVEEAICTDRARHRPDSLSGTELFTQPTKATPPRELSASQIAEQEAREKRQAARKKAHEKRTATIRGLKGAAVTDMLASMLVMDEIEYTGVDQELFELLGIEVPDSDEREVALWAYVNKSKANMRSAALAIAATRHHFNVGQYPEHQLALADQLRSAGWKPTKHDKEQLSEAEARLVANQAEAAAAEAEAVDEEALSEGEAIAAA